MTTHEPAFRRAFRKGKKFYGERDGAFVVVLTYDWYWIPLPYLPPADAEHPPDARWIKAKVRAVFIYWNPDGKRWRRFDPEREKKKMQEAQA